MKLYDSICLQLYGFHYNYEILKNISLQISHGLYYELRRKAGNIIADIFCKIYWKYSKIKTDNWKIKSFNVEFKKAIIKYK